MRSDGAHESHTLDGVARLLREGAVGVMPTDTIYGLVGSVHSKEAIERIYALKKRDKTKPLVLLISSVNDLTHFGIQPPLHLRKVIGEVWPGKTSIIFPVCGNKFSYLHRGTESLALRLPNIESVLSLLRKTGPIVATSANLEGLPHAKTIEEARAYFGTDVDFYVDGGVMEGEPSTIVKHDGKKIVIIRSTVG
jgi:L-threonylcarbamoyladenylate synthase